MKQDFHGNIEMNFEDEFDGESNVNGNSQNDFPDNEDLENAELELSGAEFSALNSAMDQLQAALDTLESRNAGIHEELLQLLQSNRDIRLGLDAQDDEDTNSDAEKETPTADEAGDRVNTATTSNSTGDIRHESSNAPKDKLESTSGSVDAQENAIARQLAGINVSKGDTSSSE